MIIVKRFGEIPHLTMLCREEGVGTIHLCYCQVYGIHTSSGNWINPLAQVEYLICTQVQTPAEAISVSISTHYMFSYVSRGN